METMERFLAGTSGKLSEIIPRTGMDRDFSRRTFSTFHPVSLLSHIPLVRS